MTKEDESLQHQIELTGNAGTGVDGFVYTKVFDALAQEPDYQLPSDFADRVIARMEGHRQSSRDDVWLVAGIFILVIGVAAVIVLSDFRPDLGTLNFGAFKFISGYPGLIIFGFVLILALQWADRRFIRPSFH